MFKIKKKTVLVVLLLFMVPHVQGQVVTVDGHVEQFNVADGEAPPTLGDWWSKAVPDTEFHVNDQKWQNNAAGDNCENYQYDAAPAGADWTFETVVGFDVSGNGVGRLHLIQGNPGCLNSDAHFECIDERVTLIQMFDGDNPGEVNYNIKDIFTTETFASEDGQHGQILVNARYDAVAETITVVTDKGDSVTKTGCAAWANHNLFQLRSNNLVRANQFSIDDLRWDNGTGVTTEVGEPLSDETTASEFDSGFVGFVSGMGFQTVESQMFVALILVGSATVITASMSKFMQPGKLKNGMVLAVAAVTASFTILIDFLELWMYVLALLISIFVVQGAQNLKNTYHEVVARVVQGIGSAPFITSRFKDRLERATGAGDRELEGELGGSVEGENMMDSIMDESDDSAMDGLDADDMPDEIEENFTKEITEDDDAGGV